MRLAAMLAVSALVHGAAVLWLAAPRERREALVIEAEPVALLWGEAAEPGAGAWPSPAGADAALEELPTEAALGPTAPQAVPVARAEPAEVEAPSAPPAEGAAGPAALPPPAEAAPPPQAHSPADPDPSPAPPDPPAEAAGALAEAHPPPPDPAPEAEAAEPPAMAAPRPPPRPEAAAPPPSAADPVAQPPAPAPARPPTAPDRIAEALPLPPPPAPPAPPLPVRLAAGLGPLPGLPGPAAGPSRGPIPRDPGCGGAFAYPEAARRSGAQGTVLLRLTVGPDGTVASAEVVESAGHPLLDQAARQAALRCRFDPAREAGRPVAATAPWRVTYRLER